MINFIERPVYNDSINAILKNHYRRSDNQKVSRTVYVVKGLAGSGKTTLLLNYFKDRNFFCFSFAGLAEDLAEKIFSDYVKEKTGTAASGWEDGFAAILKKHKIILFDDLSSISSYKRLQKAFYNNMITNIHARPFVVFIIQPIDDITGFADKYIEINIDYFSIPEVMKLYPKLSKFDALGLCAMSGGIPKILHEYDESISLEDNLKNILKPSSAFFVFMPEIMVKYFRKPENYHHILCAIANGNHSVSDIGKFCGFEYNKCDNYLASLISYGFVKTEKTISKRGAAKTAYMITNNYFRLWHLYIYRNHTELNLGKREFINNIVKNIIESEIHGFHLQKAFALANERIENDLWESFHITEKIVYAPQTVSENNFHYTFDAIVRNGDKTIFIKVFESPYENCGREELDKMRKAVSLVNKYYDSHIYIFAKKRYSDYTVAEAAKDETISLFDVDRLKY